MQEWVQVQEQEQERVQVQGLLIVMAQSFWVHLFESLQCAGTSSIPSKANSIESINQVLFTYVNRLSGA